MDIEYTPSHYKKQQLKAEAEKMRDYKNVLPFAILLSILGYILTVSYMAVL